MKNKRRDLSHNNTDKKKQSPDDPGDLEELSHKKRLDRLKKDIKRGRYSVKSHEIAEKMVQSLKERPIHKLLTPLGLGKK